MAPLCPRCGYDLSGLLATWTDRCPLLGTCTECGLGLEWGRVLVLAEHPWLFEYHWRRKPLRRLARTWLEALRPGRFWREVRLTDPVFLRPLIVVVLGLLLAAILAGYAMIVSFSYPSFRQSVLIGAGPRGTPGWRDFLTACAGEQIAGSALLVPGLAVSLAAMPLVFALLPRTLGRAKVRPAHILRLWMYSLLLPLTLLGLWNAIQAVLAAAGYPGAALSFNPWAYVDGISTTRYPVLAGIADTLPGLGLALLYTAWGGYWTWCGCRLYLGLEKPGRITAALAVIVALTASAVQFWVWNLAFWRVQGW